MRKHLKPIFTLLFSMLLSQTVIAQRTLRSNDKVLYRTTNFFVGLKGEISSGLYEYSELDDEKIRPSLGYNGGLCLEWRFIKWLSIGLDANYGCRKTRLVFNTPYLLSYSQQAITKITFVLAENTVSASLPVTVYFGKDQPWFDVYYHPFFFVAPEAYLIRGGSIKWKRTHLVDNTVIASYEMPLSNASSSDYDYGVKAGVGMLMRQRVGAYYYAAKIALSFYYGLYDTFSDKEKKNQLEVNQYHGLGDILHEQLGERYCRQVSLSVVFSLPIRNKPTGACRELGKY